jgi:hypothetical protein
MGRKFPLSRIRSKLPITRAEGIAARLYGEICGTWARYGGSGKSSSVVSPSWERGFGMAPPAKDAETTVECI